MEATAPTACTNATGATVSMEATTSAATTAPTPQQRDERADVDMVELMEDGDVEQGNPGAEDEPMPLPTPTAQRRRGNRGGRNRRHQATTRVVELIIDDNVTDQNDPPASPRPHRLVELESTVFVDDAAASDYWILRFDGACRKNPGPGGAGAALFKPEGGVFWTCCHYMPGSETNNTAEYVALLSGVESAVLHGVTKLRIEGDSHLVLSHVRGTAACTIKRLRGLRDRIRTLLKRIPTTKLVHIDRKANQHADRLANRALDMKKTTTACAAHASGDGACCHPELPIELPDVAPRHRRPPRDESEHKNEEDEDEDPVIDCDDDADDAETAVATRTNGEVFPAQPVDAHTFPTRQPRLRLRGLTTDEYDEAASRVATAADRLACMIDDATDWSQGEGYICAIPTMLRTALAKYLRAPAANGHEQRPRATPQATGASAGAAATPPPASGPPARPQRERVRPRARRRDRPPRITRHQREHRLDEALDDLRAAQSASPRDRKRIHKARRRVARIRKAQDTSTIRELFTKREKDCVEQILRDARADISVPPPSTCPVGGDELSAHYTGRTVERTPFDYDADSGEQFRRAIADSTRAPSVDDVLLIDPITVDEVEDQLKHAKGNTSPGHDGIGYDVYKRFTLQLARLLEVTFNFCWAHGRVPAIWKVGNVRLLYKKGDERDPDNWRPICLQPAIYKLYTGLLARRLSSWLETNDRLPMTQKGFRAFNGCHENNFVATTLLDQSRRLHRRLYTVWYDLKDAFGSLPQELMWRVLVDLGAAPAFVDRCRSLYDGAVYTVTNAADGESRPITRGVGVFQGCPLSPLLFVTALVPLLRRLDDLAGVGVQLAPDVRQCSAAYADDMKLFCDSAVGIQRCHDAFTAFLRWTGLRANPRKCAALGVTTTNRGNPVVDSDFHLELHGEVIPTLGLKESYTYLGVGDGFDHARHRVQLDEKLTELRHDAMALIKSKLAPWQVLKALKVYVYPRIEYALRHVRPLQSQLQAFDSAIQRGVRDMLRLPKSATTQFLYSPTSSGGLGLLPLTELHDAIQTAHAWQMLHSKDPAIQSIAREQVRQICRVRHKLDTAHWSDPARQDDMVQRFLNATLADSPHAPAKRRNGDIGSLWTDVQRHLKTWGLKFETRADGEEEELLHLRVPHHNKWLTHKTVLRHVKLHLKLQHRAKWATMADQGKTVRVHGNAGSRFITTGGAMTEAEYRFAIQARLNQLDTNAVLKRRRLRANATCRAPGCTRAETSAHVLNHCAPNMDAIRQRHDDALKRISTALTRAHSGSAATISIDRTVPEYEAAALRPDIVLRDPTTRTVVIADLAITHEDQPTDNTSSSSLQHTREFKITKYKPIAEVLERHGWRIHCAAIVYGTLGSVHPSNFATYTELLGLLKRDAKELDRTLSTHCVQRSRRIWNWHCSQHRMRQQGQSQQNGSGGNRPRTMPVSQ
jgi:ribonuclease HI